MYCFKPQDLQSSLLLKSFQAPPLIWFFHASKIEGKTLEPKIRQITTSVVENISF